MTMKLYQGTLEQAERELRYGSLPKRDFDRYLHFWTWGTFRHSGTAGHLQDRYQSRHGLGGLIKRINRVRKVTGHDLFDEID